jgi:hypothetical protein
LNFSSKIFFFILLSLPISTYGLELTSYYLTSCRREVGFNLKVQNHAITVLNLNGEILEVPRYDVIAIAKYPIDKLPIRAVSGFQDYNLNYYSVLTKYERELVPLVSGWPISFSKNKISFLSLKGEEVAIARDNIWEINSYSSPNHASFKNSSKKEFRFVHPVALKNCPYESKSAKGKVQVHPSEFVTDSVAIKRRLDHLAEEQQIVSDYVRKKKFYAVPQVYKNQSTLGFWLVQGTRYGASESRENNGAPILDTQFSDGPFGFQSTSYTGSVPNKFFVHEEAQTQFFYRFKADYFHLGFMFDPNLILVGSKYKWQTEDLEDRDQRLFESTLLEIGFDFGHFSLIAIINSSARFGFKDEQDGFREGDFNFSRYGIGYQNHLINLQAFYGSESVEDWSDQTYNYEDTYKFSLLRINANYNLSETAELQYSLIQQTAEDLVNSSKVGTLINAFYLTYDLNFKYQVSAMMSLEKKDYDKFNTTDYYFKSGAKFSIRF